MLPMNPVACRVSISRTIPSTILFALLLVLPAHANQWDSTGAALAFQEASLKRSEISLAIQPPLSLYIECAKIYRKVHSRDPHYAHAGAAIYQEGLLYQEMGDRFSELEFYKTAAKRFQLLVREYNGNQNCPDALLRLGDIYRKHLKDETAAQNAYQALRTQYKHSSATRHLTEKELSPKPPEPSKVADIPQIVSSPATHLIQNIRHWSTGEYTRVIIDMNSQAEYFKERLFGPERIYFDLPNAKLGKDLQTRTLSVDDEFLKQIRIASKSSDTIRIVLDMAQASDYSVSELKDPFRIVIDLYNQGTTNAGLKKLPFESKPGTRGDSPKTAIKTNSVLENKAVQGKAESLTKQEIATNIATAKPLEIKSKQPPRAVTEINSFPSDAAKSAPVPPVTVAKMQSSAASKDSQQPAKSPIQNNPSKAAASNPITKPTVKLPSDFVADNQSLPKTSKAIKSAPEDISSEKKLEDKAAPGSNRSDPINAGFTKLLAESKPAPKMDSPKATHEEQPLTALKNTQRSSAPSIQSNAPKAAPEDLVVSARVALPPLPAADNPLSSKAAKSDPKALSNGASEKQAEVKKAEVGASSPISDSPKAAPPTSRGDRTLTRMLGLKIGRIVLDPGHGGHDQGSIGPGGLLEKDLVLSLAIELQKLLEEKLGADVILTRYNDIFISLEERTAIANQYRADLFISIHANSSRARATSGVETYYLDFAKTKAEREIAARENATAASNIYELENLIKEIAQADKAAESRELALIVQKFLYSGAKKAIPSTQDRGVRSAPFVVLIGAKMPSVLAEVAFLSNPKVEKLLKRSTNQEHLVKALFSGIEGYVKTVGSEFVQNQIRIK
jgi:N-acetylmuramoyl-L-alanine amidase